MLTKVFGRQPLGTVFAAPYALFLALVFAYPLGLAIWISFHDYFFAAPGAQVDRPFVGLENYQTVLSDPDVQRAFVNVAIFVALAARPVRDVAHLARYVAGFDSRDRYYAGFTHEDNDFCAGPGLHVSTVLDRCGPGG